jgi:hypothetical protein
VYRNETLMFSDHGSVVAYDQEPDRDALTVDPTLDVSDAGEVSIRFRTCSWSGHLSVLPAGKRCLSPAGIRGAKNLRQVVASGHGL